MIAVICAAIATVSIIVAILIGLIIGAVISIQRLNKQLIESRAKNSRLFGKLLTILTERKSC